jgi:PAS domain S-box-containing protein
MTFEPDYVEVKLPADLGAADVRAHEDRFRTLAESLPQMIFTCDAFGTKTYCCPRYLEYTGVASASLLNDGWKDLIHPDDRTAAAKAWNESLATGQSYCAEYRMRRNDGAYRFHLARALPVHNHAGEITEWVGTITDIDDRKQVENQFLRSEKLSIAARIAASLAHEINNPLAAVTNCLYLAMEDASLSPMTRQYLRLADQELDRIGQVTTQSLRFHKQSAAAASVDLVTQIIEPSLRTCLRRFEDARISVHRKFAPTHRLFCRAQELRQVLGHLFINSCDAMPSGGSLFVRLREGTSASKDLPGIRLTIADQGKGIPSSFLPHVFEAFASTKDPTGTGLGMWVVEGIVRRHGGSIAIRSRTSGPYRGTVVTIFLPFLGVTDITS